MKQLAQEYRVSGELCRERAVMLEREMRIRQREGSMGGMEAMRLRRRIRTCRLHGSPRMSADTACMNPWRQIIAYDGELVSGMV